MKVGLVMEGGGQETDCKNNKQVDLRGFREFDTIACLVMWMGMCPFN